jgi:2-polyprenyl-3-methyl-5-hydroxy-6-metoxy-1,4-benzoquinol methylase
MLAFVDPRTHEPLERRDDVLVNPRTAAIVARIVGGIPRFVDPTQNYAESFGYQWKRWHDIRSDNRNPGYNLRQVILDRTHFDEFDLQGKTILECGMGGGDDTEALLTLPFSEVHSFDLSTSVERAVLYLKDERLSVSQASIFDIPYADASFDVVFCHRVLQHTPDPKRALECVCRKVKPGGLLFVHSYKRSRRWMAEWRYKYRWLTKRLPWHWIATYLDLCGPTLHRINKLCRRNSITAELAYRFLPFFALPELGEGSQTTERQRIELEKNVTFDALTPWYDNPMRTEDFRDTIEAAGFRILHMHDPKGSPLFCTAVRERASGSIATTGPIA